MDTREESNEYQGVKSEIVRLYDWDDIEKEICRRVGIEEGSFRDYESASETHDCWHMFMEHVFYEDIHNGHACWLYECDLEDFEDNHSWFIPVAEAYNEIIREECGSEHGSILVMFDW